MPLLMGLCLALTVHLCFDLFPRSWRGFALIWVPLYGRSTALFSWLWLGISCLVCLYLALLLIRLLIEVLLSVVGLLATFVMQSAGERSIALALGVLIMMVAITIALPSRAATLMREAAREPS